MQHQKNENKTNWQDIICKKFYNIGNQNLYLEGFLKGRLSGSFPLSQRG
jgi:hypothetical protein